MDATGGDVTVTDVPERRRYEASLGGRAVGLAAYRRDGGTVVFTHTEVDPAAEGRGVGAALARAALDDVRARGLRAVPACPFIAGWIERHPEYADLVADAG
jgi:predicted GNAT family acetyltransferase